MLSARLHVAASAPLGFRAVEKDFILNEIRRCASQNGGVPLGRERFYAATGIREGDWSGKYWVRWNDALAEAGFPPNQLNRALSETQVLRQLALFVRELGRFPVKGELRMRRRENAAFPSHNTFSRFGNRQALLTRLVQFCSSEPDLNDVAEICEPLLLPATPVENADAPSETEGFVYLVKSGKYYKVGRSNSAGRRAYEIDLQLPEPLSLVHEIATDDVLGIERYWHDRFASKHLRGEWFNLTAGDVKAFKRRKFM